MPSADASSEQPLLPAALSEVLIAELACERSLAGMLPEVVPQIARLLEHAPAVRVHALEEQLDSLSVRVSDLDSLMPVGRHSLESLGDAWVL